MATLSSRSSRDECIASRQVSLAAYHASTDVVIEVYELMEYKASSIKHASKGRATIGGFVRSFQARCSLQGSTAARERPWRAHDTAPWRWDVLRGERPWRVGGHRRRWCSHSFILEFLLFLTISR